MSIAIWIAIGVAVLAAAAPITQGGLRKIDEKQLGKYVAKAGLPLPSHLREPLLRRIAARERWALNGGLIGIVLGAALAFVTRSLDSQGGVLVMLGVVFGSSVGGVLAILLGRHQFAPDAPRMARSRATELGDYLTVGERRTARFAPLAALVPAIVATLMLALLPHSDAPEFGWWRVVTWVSAGLTLVVWLGSEVLSRKVLERPQHAESSLELAWDDVCRAESLRGLFSSPVGMAVLTSLSSLIMVGLVITDAAASGAPVQLLATIGIVVMAVSLLVVVALLIPGMMALAGPYRQQVLRQLWADADFTAEGRERTC
ncbi:MAG TPA: hypothetical protein IAA98_13325 [Candidatus Avipropionibacterium avicola]|uniref:Uncharacterized protein n=1 Tax=Candidatus Avipropionibacterium avicola TaxID=2840701 RepID=A0A9D1GZV4_9ACTN|nr:hypothetical protein [Candidatus Avipropionibacterium avicola]